MFASVEKVDLDRGLQAIVGVAELVFDLGAFIRMKHPNHPLDPEKGVGQGIDSKAKPLDGAGLDILIGVVEIVRGHDRQALDGLKGEFLREDDPSLIEGRASRSRGDFLMRPIELPDPSEPIPGRRRQRTAGP